MRWLNIHVPLWFNILLNDVWTFWPEVIGSNHTLTPIADGFDLWTVESDELLTQQSSFICQKKIKNLQRWYCHFQLRRPGALPKAAFFVTDSSFHPHHHRPPPSPSSYVWHHSINNGAINYDLLDWWIRLDRKEECSRMIILHWQTLMTSWGEAWRGASLEWRRVSSLITSMINGLIDIMIPFLQHSDIPHL